MRRFACAFLTVWLVAGQGWAQPAQQTDQPVYMDADRLGYDQKNAIVLALGNVRVVQGKSVLYADRIAYYQNQNVVRADGNVRVEDTLRGETYYADEVRLKDDLKAGIIQDFRVRLADNSQFAAREARQISETQLELKKAVFSPCEICEDSAPFWQIKADEVHIDETEQKVEYEDLFLEFYGVPVAYSPYFSHPTPDADAKSGFLIPEYSQNSNLGANVRLPYYFALAPDKDLTLTPFLMTEEAPVMIGQYRQRTDSGYFEFEGSITNPQKRDDLGLQLSEREFRGHVMARGNAQINEAWRWGFDLQRATDDTYMRRYRFGSQDTLPSRVFLEGLYDRSYVSVNSMTFQGLQLNDDPDLEPYVIPLVDGYRESEAGFLGIEGLRHYQAANLQVIARQEGTQSRRLTLQSGVKLPLATAGGHLFDAQLNQRVDVTSAEQLGLASDVDGSAEHVRVLPQASLQWRYPLMKQWQHSSLTLEPTVKLIASPSGSNPEEIANEDNAIVEFTEANLFRLNPFPGLDTVDEGSRAAYGMRGQWLFNSGNNVQFLFGQSYQVEDDTPFPYNNDPGEHFSDYVGHVTFDYQPFKLSYRYRLDQEDFAPNSSSVGFQYRQNPFNLNVNYVTIEDDIFLDNRQEVLVGLGTQLTDEWSVNLQGRRDLLLDEMLYAGFGVVYQNDCFMLAAQFNRTFIRDRDIEPDNNVSLRVSFKGLNEL